MSEVSSELQTASSQIATDQPTSVGVNSETQQQVGAGKDVAETKETVVKQKEPNPLVFFDVDFSGDYAGRVEITLFKDIAPKTCDNFLKLCTHENNIKGSKNGLIHGTMVGFRKSMFHHAQAQYCAGGDYTRDKKGASAKLGDGRGEKFFERENFVIKHDSPGIVSMVNIDVTHPDGSVRTANGSLFIITNAPLPSLDGKFVAFGKVTHGMEVIQRICTEAAFQPPATNGISKTVCIDECGQLA